MPAEALFQCSAIGKSFAGVRVLDNVSFSVESGRMLGLVGENGAGKSTLMNLIGGVHKPDAGSMSFLGAPHTPRNPLDAALRGIAFVHQELNLFPNLSIAENLFLADFPKRRILGMELIDRTAVRRRTRTMLERVELAVAPDTLVESLTQGERQLVEVARALESDAKLILFDEPTTSLSSPECERLFAILERQRAAGTGLIYISHALDDVLRLCDDVAILRDGRLVAAGPRSGFTRDSLITAMVGRPIEQLYPARDSAPLPEIALEARGLSQPGIVESVSFRLQRGEILGIAGLMGSGRSELARILFGLDPCAQGEVLLGGREIGAATPRERIGAGMAFLTESRRDDGLFMDASCAENLEIVHPDASRVTELARELRIVCANLDRQPVRQLSGGNQQKVALGKWLVRPPKVLILDEPTRGIDVGAKAEIYRVINELAARGVGLLVISSELEELMGVCDRILALGKGEIRAEFRREFNREAILEAAV